MGKRSDFKRHKGDFYRTTDERALLPLLPHLKAEGSFVEPCAGQGDLLDLMAKLAPGLRCSMAFDLMPQRGDILQGDALQLTELDVLGADYIITNPPWSRELLHPMIQRFMGFAPTWLLFDADWKHTEQAGPLLAYCAMVVSVGRVRWMKDTKSDGKDNAAWYLFHQFEPTDRSLSGRQGPVFIPRSPEICERGRIALSMNRPKRGKRVSDMDVSAVEKV